MQDAQSAGFSSGGKLPYPAFAEVVWTVLLRIIPIIQGEAASPSQSLRDSSPKGRALGSPRKLHLFAKASPFGRGGCERSEQTERARLLPAAPPLPQEAGAANAVFLHDPTREKANRENPQIFPIGKFKIILP